MHKRWKQKQEQIRQRLDRAIGPEFTENERTYISEYFYDLYSIDRKNFLDRWPEAKADMLGLIAVKCWNAHSIRNHPDHADVIHEIQGLIAHGIANTLGATQADVVNKLVLTGRYSEVQARAALERLPFGTHIRKDWTD